MTRRIDNRYELVRQIGASGTATFWEGRDGQMQRSVIIKLFTQAPNPKEQARFERELQLLGALRSPHVLRMFSYGQSEGHPYLVFEHVPGGTLATTMTSGAPVHVVRSILSQTAEALAEAHHLGLVHRGVAPDAIRIFESANDTFIAKLADFGLLRDVDGSQRLTATGHVVGVPEYMSPEQLAGHQMSGASDVYSLGVVGAFMLRGPVAPAGPHEVARRVSSGDFSVLRPDAAELAPALRAMLSPDPSQRPGAMRVPALLAPARGPSPPRVERTTAPTDRGHSRLWPAVMVAAVTIVAAAAFFAMREPEVQPVVATKRSQASGLTQISTPAEPPSSESERADLGTAGATIVASRTGCGKSTPLRGTGTLQRVEGLETESWVVHVGEGYDPAKPAPMIVLVHQLFRTAPEFLAQSGFVELADKHGLVIVAPEDKDMLVWKENTKGQVDYELVVRNVEATREKLCIDESKIFVVGQGQGGAIAVNVACEPWVAGIATSGHGTGSTVTHCDERQVPSIQLHPLHSKHAPFNGGPGCQSGEKVSAKAWEKAWRTRNGCSNASEETYRDGGTTCREWSCDVPYSSCHVNGGQAWPGAPPRRSLLADYQDCDGPTSAFPAAEQVWQFFSESVE